MHRRSTRDCLIAAALGIAITCVDLFADHGETSPPVILLLFVIAGGLTVAVHTRLSWTLLILVAIWLPAVHLELHAFGHKTTLQPDTAGSILLVGLVGLFAVAIGGLIGAAAVRSIPALKNSN